jgi:hypothetical protein
VGEDGHGAPAVVCESRWQVGTLWGSIGYRWVPERFPSGNFNVPTLGDSMTPLGTRNTPNGSIRSVARGAFDGSNVPAA